MVYLDIFLRQAILASFRIESYFHYGHCELQLGVKEQNTKSRCFAVLSASAAPLLLSSRSLVPVCYFSSTTLLYSLYFVLHTFYYYLCQHVFISITTFQPDNQISLYLSFVFFISFILHNYNNIYFKFSLEFSKFPVW